MIYPSPAHAQRTFFDFFRGPWSDQQDPRLFDPELRPRPRPKPEISDASPRWNEKPKDVAARTILVIGDEQAAGLAQGLRESFASDVMAVVKPQARDESTLLTTKNGDWLALAREALNTERPAAVVVMLGLNDIPPSADKSSTFGTPPWEQTFNSRASALLTVLRERGLPTYWVGLPIARNRALNAKLAYLNGLIRAQTQQGGAKFIDAWDSFANEDGEYMVIGPDVNGNTRRLRRADGYTLTPAGNRKLAFYIDVDIRRDVVFGVPSGASVITDETPTAPSNDPLLTKTFAGPILTLTNGPVPQNQHVLGGPDDQSRKIADTLPETARSAPKPGRADDFSWIATP